MQWSDINTKKRGILNNYTKQLGMPLSFKTNIANRDFSLGIGIPDSQCDHFCFIILLAVLRNIVIVWVDMESFTIQKYSPQAYFGKKTNNKLILIKSWMTLFNGPITYM